MRTLLILFLAFSLPAFAVDRSSTARRHFAAEHPCPATNVAKPDHCLGYVIDHIQPLCAGGADAATNMQWSRLAVSKIKDRVEKATCYCLRRYGPDAGCPVIDWKSQPATKRRSM